MLNLFKLLGGPWEDVRQGLQDDLEHIEAAINQFYGEQQTNTRAAATAASIAPVTSQILVATKVISHADILTLPTTPVDILGAAGIGRMIIPHFITLTSSFSVAYANINAVTFAALAVFYSTSGDQWSNLLADGPADSNPFTYLSDLLATTTPSSATLNRFTAVGDVASEWGNLAVTILSNPNQGLQLVMDNDGAGDLTGGTATNRLTVRTYYTTEAS